MKAIPEEIYASAENTYNLTVIEAARTGLPGDIVAKALRRAVEEAISSYEAHVCDGFERGVHATVPTRDKAQ